MDDIPKWLKDDLGLPHMCEADLNGLIFHPRYGTYCRSLTNFLVRSTLCNIKYPDVYANEEFRSASKYLSEKKGDLHDITKTLEIYIREQENKERELIYMRSRLDHMRNIKDLVSSSIVAFEDIVNRQNDNIDLVQRVVEKADYLSKSDLSSLYPLNFTSNSDSTISARQMASVDEELAELRENISQLHRSISAKTQAILSKMDNVDVNVKPMQIQIHNLNAVKIPDIDELVVTMDPEVKEMRDTNVALYHRVIDLNQQVTELGNQYKIKRLDLLKRYKDDAKTDQCNGLSGRFDLDQIENLIQAKETKVPNQEKRDLT